MSTTIFTSLHIFVALLSTTAGIIMIISDIRNKRSRAVGAILFLFALSSFAFSFEINALSARQALIWIVIEFFIGYATPAASILVALHILRPQAANKKWLSIPLWILILLPLVISLLDVTGISSSLFGTHLIFNTAEIMQQYTGGYLPIGEATTGPLSDISRYLLIGIFTVFMVYPLLFVAVRDRKAKPVNRDNALLLLAITAITAVFQIALQDYFPPTTSSLVANVLFSIGFFIAGYRMLDEETGQSASAQNLFQNYPMVYKITIATAAIVFPAIIFIGFSIFSFFQAGLLDVTSKNIYTRSEREAKQFNNILENHLHHLESLQESARLLSLLGDRHDIYQGLSQAQIRQQIQGREQQWHDQNTLLISAIMDPVYSTDIRERMNEFPEMENILVIDQYGALLTAGQTPAHYDYAAEPWWLYITANKNTYIGSIQFEPEAETFYTTIAIPLVDETEQVIGGVITTLSLEEAIASINASRQESVHYGFVNSYSQLIPMQNTTESELISLPPNAIVYAQSPESGNITQLEGESHILKLASVSSPEGHFSVPWFVTAYQPVDQALTTLFTARAAILITYIVIIALSALIAVGLTRSITQPLSELTGAAEQLLEGNRDISIDIHTNDELGTLAATFTQMAAELTDLVEGLEQTIEERTKDLERRAVQMETSAIVAQQAAEIQDVSTLLDKSVQLISEKFGYYHAGIFLLDEQRNYAVLAAANSEGGQKMLARGHKLQVGRVGVVGYAAGTGQPRIAQDVGADVVYYDNPDMPHTRSEMALPLFVRGEVIGVIDVQSNEANAFTQDDITALQILANQIALAIEKARLLETSQKALIELQRLYGEQAALAWKQKLTGQEIAYQYDATGFTKMLGGSSQPAADVTGVRMNKEIKYRGQVIGLLDFVRDQNEGGWTEDEEALIEEILEQTALALENARLVDQIKLRSDQIQLLQEITAMAASTLEETSLLDQVTEKLHTSLDNNQCGVVLFGQNDKAHLAACTPTPEKAQMTGAEIPLDSDPYHMQAHTDTHAFVIQNLQDSSKFKTFINTFNVKDSHSLILLPLSIREKAFGYIYMAEAAPDREMGLEENKLYGQIQAQISTAVESARLFAAEQQAREAAAALLEITQISSASLDINEVLNEATYRSAEAIQANRCTILLLDEREKIKPLISVYQDGTQMEEKEWEMLVEKIKATYQNVPLRTLAASLRVPTRIESPLTYEKFPLGWTQAFGIEKLLMVPLISQNKVIGSMAYDLTDQEKSFSQSQVELAQTIAGQIATTLENANLFDQAIRRAERERQVTEISAKLRASNNPEDILEIATSELRLALAKQEIQEKQKTSSAKRKTSAANGKEALNQ